MKDPVEIFQDIVAIVRLQRSWTLLFIVNYKKIADLLLS